MLEINVAVGIAVDDPVRILLLISTDGVTISTVDAGSLPLDADSVPPQWKIIVFNAPRPCLLHGFLATSGGVEVRRQCFEPCITVEGDVRLSVLIESQVDD